MAPVHCTLAYTHRGWHCIHHPCRAPFLTSKVRLTHELTWQRHAIWQLYLQVFALMFWLRCGDEKASKASCPCKQEPRQFIDEDFFRRHAMADFVPHTHSAMARQSRIIFPADPDPDVLSPSRVHHLRVFGTCSIVRLHHTQSTHRNQTLSRKANPRSSSWPCRAHLHLAICTFFLLHLSEPEEKLDIA